MLWVLCDAGLHMADNNADTLLTILLKRHELRCFVDDRVRVRVQKELRNAAPPRARTEQALRDLVEDSAKMRDIFNSMVASVRERAQGECARIVDDSVACTNITQRVEARAEQRMADMERRYEAGVSRAKWMAGTALAMSAASGAAALYLASQLGQRFT